LYFKIFALCLSVAASPVYSHDFNDINKAQISRYDVVLGNSGGGLTGFLANPTSETEVVQKGVWFPPNMDLMVFPQLSGIGVDGVKRVLIKGNNGVFAWMRPNAIRRLPSNVEKEAALVDGPSFRLAFWGRGRSSLTIECGQKKVVGAERELSLSIDPPIWLSGAAKLTETVSLEYTGDASRQYFIGYEEITKVSFSVELTRSCQKGAATGGTIASVRVGDASLVVIDAALLKQFALARRSETSLALVSCLDQYEQLDRLLADKGVARIFRPIVISLIAEWKEFGKFSNCIGSKLGA